MLAFIMIVLPSRDFHDCIRNLLSLEKDLLVVAETGNREDLPAFAYSTPTRLACCSIFEMHSPPAIGNGPYREQEIVTSVAQGFKNKDIAEKIVISEQTVRNPPASSISYRTAWN